MKQFHLGNPGEGEVVIGPGAGNEDGNLVVLGPVEGPLVVSGQSFHDVDRVFGAILGDSLDQGHKDNFRREMAGRRKTTHTQPMRFDGAERPTRSAYSPRTVATSMIRSKS